MRVWTLLRQLLWGLLLIPLSISFNSHAEKTIALYDVESLVVNQSATVRQRAAADGLKTVLIRLSGNTNIDSNPEWIKAFANASAYLDGYRYQSTTETLMIAGSQQRGTLLLMRFNPTAVQALAEQAGLALWSATRPDILLWAADDRRGKQYIDLGSTFAEQLNRAANLRGLPLTLPVFDLEDRSALPVNRLWALDEVQTKRASQRYASNAVLLGRFSLLQKKWNASFVLSHQQKTVYLNAQGETENAVSQMIIDQVADYFANLYAVPTRQPAAGNTQPVIDNASPLAVPDSPRVISDRRVRYQGPSSLLIEIENISNFTSYAGLMSYLESLPIIESISILSANQPSLVLGLRLKGSREQLLSTFSLDNKLQPISSDISGSGVSQPRTFLWR